ncbi:integrase catalytic region [Entamoeba histolytica]|uniref:Integrase catalytic region n=2 Tax=Entamoeba histolytica TaxID=5759 RepID=A0A175JKI8_ENTHI|nr:integrase catalytic region [Entamoeba histolytica]
MQTEVEKMTQKWYFIENEEEYAFWINLFANHLSRTKHNLTDNYVAKKREKCFALLIKILKSHLKENQKCFIVKKEGCFFCPYDVVSYC